MLGIEMIHPPSVQRMRWKFIHERIALWGDGIIIPIVSRTGGLAPKTSRLPYFIGQSLAPPCVSMLSDAPSVLKQCVNRNKNVTYISAPIQVVAILIRKRHHVGFCGPLWVTTI
jgi:hypothetical protein